MEDTELEKTAAVLSEQEAQPQTGKKTEKTKLPFLLQM